MIRMSWCDGYQEFTRNYIDLQPWRRIRMGNRHYPTQCSMVVRNVEMSVEAPSSEELRHTTNLTITTLPYQHDLNLEVVSYGAPGVFRKVIFELWRLMELYVTDDVSRRNAITNGLLRFARRNHIRVSGGWERTASFVNAQYRQRSFSNER